MKVLFNTYPMAFHTPGGGEMQLRAYERHLPRHGVQVAPFQQWAPDLMSHDIVHFFSCIGGSIHFCQFVKNLGLPLVVSSSLWITEATTHLYPLAEIKGQLELADRVITNSDCESETLSHVLSLPRGKFFTVYNGIDDFFLREATASLFRTLTGIGDRFVLNVGNIEPRKNQLSLIRAMKAFPELKIVLIGHQRDPIYAARVIEEGGRQVSYLGPMEQGDLMLSAYRACELFCLPSTLETPGLAALEALGQEAPLVVTQEGSCAEYFGTSATYVDPDSIESIERGIAETLGRYGRKPLPGAKDLAQRFLWSETTLRLVDVYSDLLRSGKN